MACEISQILHANIGKPPRQKDVEESRKMNHKDFGYDQREGSA